MASLGGKLGGLFSRFTVNTAQQAVGFGSGAAIGAALQPEIQDVLNIVWPGRPNVPASPLELAAAVVQGVLTQDVAAEEAKKSGIDSDVFDILVRINGMPPGAETLLSMMDRGIISEQRVRTGLLQSHVKPEWVDAIIATNPALLQVSELAEMVVQGVITQGEATPLAAYLSYSPENFDKLVRLAGSPPGPEQSLEAWNRGIFSEDDVNRAILQSRLKPEWLEQYKKLRYRPLSASIAVEAVLRQRISEAEGIALAEKSGMDAESFKIALETSGRSMGVEQALQLARRGVFTYNDFLDVVARSDVKTEFAPNLWELKEALPGIMQLRNMIHANAISDELAHTYLMKEGYSEELAQATIKSGHATKTQGTKDITAAIIETFYVAGIDSHPQAVAALEKLGYDATEAADYLQAWEARRIASEIVHGVTMVRSRFTGWKIDAREAQADLVDFTLTPETITRLIEWWTNERHANAPQLTHAAITTGFKYGRYTYDEATQLLLTQGWSIADALTLLWNTMHGDPRDPNNQKNVGTPVNVIAPPTTP